ncbi:alpha/beta hydrolase [Sulfurospirillum sp. MES]|uniref:alpha/beta fold hydrolase n=1 Tax=Sulfurospirillum sp. MES TaxID=1565314 RepID=UPI0005444293|nr:alpha/beta hydrolase [Sulfurospirillum sp. MES]KHG34223.1 MAG: 2-hydroxy-6-oxohepta-2,4-dienoate hydrolase [Sulfurospirillum sp. MES]
MAKKEILFEGARYRLSYEMLRPHCEKAILFLHGWGSNKESMKHAFSKTFPYCTHLYLDLPGFGDSSIEERVLNSQEYAAIVNAFLDALSIRPWMIVGHSFGGKVATLLHPEILVLLSSAGIVAPKSFKVRFKIALFKCFKPFFPKRFYRFFATKDVEGMSETMYEILKCVVNEDFSDTFAKIRSQTFIFWGKEDKATPLLSGETIHTLIAGSRFFPLEGDHFFFLRNGETIEKIMMESLG